MRRATIQGKTVFHSKSLIMVVTATQFCFAVTHANASTPARFAEGGESLENLIAFPDVPGDVGADVYCRAVISTDGEMKQNFCFRSANVDQAFRDSIDDAARSARLSPAVVSGEPHRVIFSYRVVFVRADDRSLIRVFPNWARDTDKYGNEYDGPQRLSRLMRPRTCITRGVVSMNSTESLRASFDEPSVSLIATLTIDASGEPMDDVAFESASNVDDASCRSSVTDRLADADYISGHHNGEPVDATFVQTIGDREDMEFQ